MPWINNIKFPLFSGCARNERNELPLSLYNIITPELIHPPTIHWSRLWLPWHGLEILLVIIFSALSTWFMVWCGTGDDDLFTWNALESRKFNLNIIISFSKFEYKVVLRFGFMKYSVDRRMEKTMAYKKVDWVLFPVFFGYKESTMQKVNLAQMHYSVNHIIQTREDGRKRFSW